MDFKHAIDVVMGKRKRKGATYGPPGKRARYGYPSGMVGQSLMRTGGYIAGPSYGLGVGEKKFFDTVINEIDFLSAANVTPSFNLITGGAGESQHGGRTAIITDFYFRFTIKLVRKAANAVHAGHTGRLILYVDRQANGAAATLAQILQATAADSLFEFQNLENIKRFDIFYDEKFTLNFNVVDNQATPDLTEVVHYAAMAKHWKNGLMVDFSGTTGVIAEVRSNNIGALYCATTGAVNTITCTGVSRVRFRDG